MTSCCRKRIERSVDDFTVLDWIALERSMGHTIHYQRDDDGVMYILISFIDAFPRSRRRMDAYIDGKWKARAWENANPNWKELVAQALDAELLAEVTIASAGSQAKRPKSRTRA